jgi:hypothetical protein
MELEWGMFSAHFLCNRQVESSAGICAAGGMATLILNVCMPALPGVIIKFKKKKKKQ